MEKMAKLKFLNTFPIETHRLKGHDYGSCETYFVTIKTFQMNHYFIEKVQTSYGTSQPNETKENFENAITSSNISLQSVEETCFGTSGRLSRIGIIAKQNWEAIPDHFATVILDTFQIMPNHIHGIISINSETTRTRKPNEFKAMKGTLGTILNLYQGSVTKFANENNIEFKWHPRYHDMIIRDENALQNIRKYISQNPQKWLEKHGFSKNFKNAKK